MLPLLKQVAVRTRTAGMREAGADVRWPGMCSSWLRKPSSAVGSLQEKAWYANVAGGRLAIKQLSCVCLSLEGVCIVVHCAAAAFRMRVGGVE